MSEEAVNIVEVPHLPITTAGPPLPSRQKTGPNAWVRSVAWWLVLSMCVSLALWLEDQRLPVLIWVRVGACFLGSFSLVRLLPWRMSDSYVSAWLLSLSPGFRRDHWDSCAAPRLRVGKIMVFGIFIVVLLPFGLLWRIVPHFYDLTRSAIPGQNIWELWEIAVCAWSVIFMFFIFFYDHPENFIKRQVSCFVDQDEVLRRVWALGVISVVGWLALSGLTVVMILFIGRSTPALRIMAELLVVIVFCVFDALLFVGYRSKARVVRGTDSDKACELEARSVEFLQFLLIVDGPALLGFLVLELYLLFFKIDKSWGLPFVAGASAFSLIVVNTVYFFLYWRERYLGVARHAHAAS